MDDDVDMSNNAPRQKKRCMTKCSACREKKLKCEPGDRDWERRRQKCDYCIKHEQDCSPNYSKNDDPAVQSRNGDLGTAEGCSSQHPRHSALVSTIASIAPASPTVNQSLDPSMYEGIYEIPGLSDGKLEEKALSKQHQFNERVIILETYIAQLKSSRIHGYDNEDPYHQLAAIYEQVKDELHHLFICIVELGVHADTRAQTWHAQCIYLRLLFAWEKHPELHDNRKRHTLLKIANFFEKSNHGYEAERILDIVAKISPTPMVPFDQSPSHMLAQSFLKTSDGLSRALRKIWEGRHGLGGVPPNLALPPLQRAALYSNSDVVVAVFSNPNSSLHAPDILDQQALHIAAERDLTSELSRCIQAVTVIDTRDCYNRRVDACRALIEAGADITNRDICGRTILGVAARGRHLPAVEYLVGCGAEVNPAEFCCPSTASTAPTPLHAAIESSNEQLSRFLFDQGADVSDRRKPDDKSAIELAHERGWSFLAEDMRRKQSYQQCFPWLTG